MYKNAPNNSCGFICYLSAILKQAASQAAAARITGLSKYDMKGSEREKEKANSF